MIYSNLFTMARIPNGILGAFIGKAGNVSGYMRNGENFIRSKRRKTSKEMTPKRIAQQQKIKVCNEFTSVFSGTGFFNKSFPAYGNTGTGHNRATSAIMNLAIVGSYPGINISYQLILISKGVLPAAENANASVNNEGNIFFSWTDNSGTGTAKASDKVILLAYFPAARQIVYSLSAAVRADCQALLITSAMKGFEVHSWIGFLSEDEKDAANSIYTGELAL